MKLLKLNLINTLMASILLCNTNRTLDNFHKAKKKKVCLTKLISRSHRYVDSLLLHYPTCRGPFFVFFFFFCFSCKETNWEKKMDVKQPPRKQVGQKHNKPGISKFFITHSLKQRGHFPHFCHFFSLKLLTSTILINNMGLMLSWNAL